MIIIFQLFWFSIFIISDFKPFVMSFDVGDFIDVNPSYSKTPDDFSCQVLTENNIIAFSQMTSKLQEVYSALSSSDSTMDTLSVDMPCCAFYSGKPHRAE